MDNSSLKNYYIIQIGKGLLYVTGSFILGFFGFFIVNRKKFLVSTPNNGKEYKKNKDPKNENDDSMNDIPYDTMLKIIKKIKNKMIILLANLHDKTVLLNITEDLKNKKNAQNKDDNIIIETISSGEIARAEDSLDQKAFNKSKSAKASQRVHQTNQMINMKAIRDKIIRTEIEIVNDSGFRQEQYLSSLRNYILNNEEIKRHVKFLSNFKTQIEQDELPDFDFGDDIRKNYLKVVTNIYYLNIRRVQKSFKEDYIDKGFVFKENRHINQVMNELYSKHLKETRSEVSKFFNLKENADLDMKIILRLFYYYLIPFDERRIKMDEVNQEVNEILSGLSLGYEFPVLLNDNHPHAITKPRDAVVDFKYVLKERKSIENIRFENESLADSLEKERDFYEESTINQTVNSKIENNYESKMKINKEFQQISKMKNEKYKNEN